MKNQKKIELLESLIELNKVSKILNTFIPAFNKGILKEDGKRYLHGNFNLNLVRKLIHILDENKQMIKSILSGELKGFIREILCRKSPKQGNSYW